MKTRTFLGMEIEQSNRLIKPHLDHYVREMLNDSKYKAYIKKSLRPKRVPISSGVILRPENSLTLPDPSKQKIFRSFVAKLQFAASLFSFYISLQYRSWLDSVLRQGQPTGQHFIT